MSAVQARGEAEDTSDLRFHVLSESQARIDDLHYAVGVSDVTETIKPRGIAGEPNFRKRNEFCALRSSVSYTIPSFLLALIKIHEYG